MVFLIWFSFVEEGSRLDPLTFKYQLISYLLDLVLSHLILTYCTSGVLVTLYVVIRGYLLFFEGVRFPTLCWSCFMLLEVMSSMISILVVFMFVPRVAYRSSTLIVFGSFPWHTHEVGNSACWSLIDDLLSMK